MKNSSSYYGQHSKQMGRKPSKEQLSGQPRAAYDNQRQTYDTNKFVGHQHAPSYDRVTSKGRNGSAAKRYQNDVEPTTVSYEPFSHLSQNQRAATTKKSRPQSSKPVPSSAVTYASATNI